MPRFFLWSLVSTFLYLLSHWVVSPAACADRFGFKLAHNLFIDSLFALLFAFFSRMGKCLSRLFFKGVRCQTKVNFSLTSV
jgi:hypothetical protein